MNTQARPTLTLDRLYTNDETAGYLRIKPETLERKRNGRSGDRGPRPTYVGRFPRYSGRAIAAYLNQGLKHGS